jgi:protein-S-isoprenylcysteine O-methyltransferase Ste14
MNSASAGQYTSGALAAQAPDTVVEWLLAGAGFSTLGVFAVALQNFFVQPPTLTRLQRLFQDVAVLIGVTHGLALLVLDSAGFAWAFIGIVLYSAALGLFLSAIEAARRVPMTRAFVYTPRCDTVLTAGPYRVIRHPVYLSYSMAWLAAPIATHSVLLGLTAIFMITCYVISAREEERLLATGARSAEFAKRLGRTWRFIPFIY